jgi:hypothetical protein
MCLLFTHLKVDDATREARSAARGVAGEIRGAGGGEVVVRDLWYVVA